MTDAGFPPLRASRARLELLAPGFDAALSSIPFLRRESDSGEAVRCFKQSGPVALLIPRAAGGLGASALDAVRVQHALGARSPSLAVATTMHQFSVASLIALVGNGGAAEALMLGAIATQRLILSSGFAEGDPGKGILDSNIRVTPIEGGVLLDGSKKPCSLSGVMDLLTASFVRATPEGDELMVALIPARTPGLGRKPFWGNRALAGAQSDEVTLEAVRVPDRMIFSAGLKHRLVPVQIVGFIWFELLMSASYLGICAGLVEQVVSRGRWNDADRVELACALQVAMSALEGEALQFEAADTPLDEVLARVLLMRYGIEPLIASTTDKAHEMLGGNSFITSDESSMWLLSARGLRFHPPARISMHGRLSAFLQGGPFSMSSRETP
jgi:alkylation response protein AidB-like acyl-CoA dehydrogenase